MNRAVTGHEIIPNYQVKMFEKSSRSSCGEIDADVNHIINKCTMWTDYRNKYFTRKWLQKDIGT